MLYNIVLKANQSNSTSNQKSAHKNTKSAFQIPPMSSKKPSGGHCLPVLYTERSAETAHTAAEIMQKNGGMRYSSISAHRKESKRCNVQIGTRINRPRIQISRRDDRMTAAQNDGSAQENRIQSGRKSPHQRCGTAAGNNSAFHPSNEASSRPGRSAVRKQNRKSGFDRPQNNWICAIRKERLMRRQNFTICPPMRC